MAGLPGWRHDLSAATRWVAAHGLSTALTAPPAPLDDIAWTQLRGEVHNHRLEGLLVDAVATADLPVTADQADETAELEIELTHGRLWQERRLIEVVDLIESAGIEVRALKGLALATLDYPDAQMRPTGDLDLLVRARDIDRVGEVIVAAGGLRIDPDPLPGFSARVAKGATYATVEGEIDLHRLLVWGPLGVRLDPDLLWQTERGFTIGGRRLATLGLDDTLLHACCHLLVLGAREARQLRDIAQLWAEPDLDVECLLGRARRWGAEAVLATAVVLTAAELGLGLDDELGRWAEGYPPTWRDRLWLRVERPGDPLAGIEAVATWLELPTHQARTELVRATLHPEPGTWAAPTQRIRQLGKRLAHQA